MKKDKYIQYLRGIAIISVILIHILPNGFYTIIARQFINFCVGMFLFLSGYLVNKNIIDIKQFYIKRISRVVIPYIFWSIIFIIKSDDYNVNSIIFRVITGQTCSIYYYIIVYLEFILITPILLRLVENKKCKYIWLLTPISIVIIYIFSYIGLPIPFPYNVLSFTVWFIFYYYGLIIKNKNLELKLKLNRNIAIYLLFLTLSIIEGFLWNEFGNYSMAISQIKLTSVFTSLYFIKILMGIKDKIKFESKILKKVGDYSFGIYLTHMIFVDFYSRYISINYINTALIMVLVLISNCILIYIVNKLLGYKISRIIGFV